MLLLKILIPVNHSLICLVSSHCIHTNSKDSGLTSVGLRSGILILEVRMIDLCKPTLHVSNRTKISDHFNRMKLIQNFKII
jgi:hypothetical protein